MPFQSEKQRRYLWANEPEIARDWTDTYGSRIRRDDGGITNVPLQAGAQNYLGEQEMVRVPKHWKSGKDHPKTELAYITKPELDLILKADFHGSLKEGPNVGPGGVMSLNDPATGRTGAEMSQMETRGTTGIGQHERATPESRDIRAGFVAAGAQPTTQDEIQAYNRSQWDQRFTPLHQRTKLGTQTGIGSGWKKFNPLSVIGGLFGNVGRIAGGILGMQKDWAGKMRGGINPETNKYYTQAEFEQKRQDRRNQASIDRILKTKGKYDSGLIDRDWDQSPLKQRLADLGYTGELAQGKNEFGLYTDRITPGDSGERIGEYWRDDQGIAGTQAYEKFSPNVALSKDMRSLQADAIPYETFGADQPVDKYAWDKVVDDKTPYEGTATQAAFVKDKFLQEQQFSKDKLNFQREKKYNVREYMLGSLDPAGEKGLVNLYRELRSADKTVGQLIKELQTGKYDVLGEKITNDLKEHILEKVNFGETFKEGKSLTNPFGAGTVDPEIRDNRLWIDEGKLEDKGAEQYLNIAEGGRITKALGGRSRDI